jgi:hypothetical protein
MTAFMWNTKARKGAYSPQYPGNSIGAASNTEIVSDVEPFENQVTLNHVVNHCVVLKHLHKPLSSAGETIFVVRE